MSFLKKNPLFSIVVAICVAAFLVGLYLTLTASKKVEQAKSSLESTEIQLNSLLNASPAPTEENHEKAQRNLEELQAKLTQIREDLQQGATLTTSEDGVSVLAGIQQYISKFKKAVASHVDENGEAAPVKTPDNFAFGFSKYIRGSAPEDPDKITRLDKQRHILDYLLTQLIEADPQSIESVEREILEEKEEITKSTFSIDPVVSARVPGAIDTMAFRLRFSGYTNTLREFLNRLAEFELPIVVRSIRVERPSGSDTLVAPSRNTAQPDNVFGLFSEEESSGASNQVTEVEQKPVIEENISKFTVIVEFIEVILPDAQTQEVSDPA